MDDKWQELREIEAKRNDLTVKLQKIEERKANVSTEVYQKVKREYEEKLRNLEEKMAGYVDLMKSELTTIQQDIEALTEDEQAVQLKIEEIELRYSIGEYDEESYTKLMNDNKQKLEDINSKRQSLDERKAMLEQLSEVQVAEQLVEPAETPLAEAEASITIDEHILEEKVPEEDRPLDALISDEDAVRPETEEEPTVSKKPPSKPGTEPEKSVACPKCGALNAPDSWYCEKCGAEILDTPAE
jgi:chromosome segregation ATPase